jgi:hypothetical protein
MSAGTQQFWVVDPEKRTVHVTSIAGTAVYAGGEAIPVPLLGDDALIPVDEIFAA